MVEVIGTDEFKAWYLGLGDNDAEAVGRVVLALEEKGPNLGFPQSSDVRDAKAMRELRVQSGGRPLRIFYAFDPRRNAVLLIGGVKTGTSDARFYREMVPRAKRIWKQYLAEQARGEHDKENDE